MLIPRLAKIAMVASIAAFASLVVLGNITDYGTNFEFVRHVLAMDTIRPGSTIGSRAITNPALHHAAYAVIIAAEALTAALCWIGALRLLYSLRAGAPAFNRAKACAVAGLTLGFLTWQLGFMTIGGEWFAMWMSPQWNGVPSAFRFVMVIVAVLIFVVMRDEQLVGRADD
jgi:predicted small integral membrane protein